MTTDLIVLQRMQQFIEAMDKMHNGLLAMIEAHQEYVAKSDERLAKLEAEIKTLKARLPE